MATVNKKALFPCDIQKVWDIVTSLENTAWRSDCENPVRKLLIKPYRKK